MSEETNELAEQYGGYWGEHPIYTEEDWVIEVRDGNTRLGYWDWVQAQIDLREES